MVRRGSPSLGRNLLAPLHGAAFIGMAVVTSFFAYLWGSTSPNPAALLAAGLFWYAVAFLLFTYPFRGAFQIFRRYISTKLGASVFAGYLSIHVLLYGFLLEGILVSVFAQPFVTNHATVYVTTSVFAPATISNAILGLWFNPWMTVTIPPSFVDSISFYSLAIAAVIAILIVANIGKARELGTVVSKGMKSRTLVILPALGIVLGASCCLSVPILFTVDAPSLFLLTNPLWLYDITYFLFPLAGVTLLYLNLHSIGKITANARHFEPGDPSPRNLAPLTRPAIEEAPPGEHAKRGGRHH
jgi:hypothetical protein